MSQPDKPPQIDSPEAFARKFLVSRETLARFNLYESLLRRWQPAVNLVAPTTLSHVWGRHFADSAQLASLVPASAKSLADLGSGGGFPGLVLAILLGGERLDRVVLVESDQRKAAFLREVARQTGTAVEVVSARIESPAARERIGKVEVVSARALASLDALFELAAPLLAENGIGLFLKGKDAAAEIESARVRWQFEVELTPSLTDNKASVVTVRGLRRRA